MSLPAVVLEFPVVVSVDQPAANDRPMVGTPIVRPTTLSMWHLFEALQDAVDESGATPSEADALVMAAYFEVQQSVVSGSAEDRGDWLS
ncbi:MAG: hypothetical protein KUG77_12585 [Nannocystaceae bacterium]|nr:hypothetical protein [Nannocystaceae bacterium]